MSAEVLQPDEIILIHIIFRQKNMVYSKLICYNRVITKLITIKFCLHLPPECFYSDFSNLLRGAGNKGQRLYSRLSKDVFRRS